MSSEKNAVFLLLKWGRREGGRGRRKEKSSLSHAVKVKFAGTRTRPGEKQALCFLLEEGGKAGVGRNLLRF